jgi:hypothetical protein
MKKILILFVLALLSTVVSATPNPTPENNYLILKGFLPLKEKTTVLVFEHDTTTCSWNRIEQQTTKKSYELLLNPQKAYQIWFQAPGGYLRIVYIDPGDAGMWHAHLSINFNPESLAFIHLYQTCSEQELGVYYAEFITSRAQAEDVLPAMNCEACDESEDRASTSN